MVIESTDACEICKRQDSLTAHHIIPRFILCFFNEYFKHNNKAILCRDCHDEVEKLAEKFRTKIKKKYGISSWAMNNKEKYDKYLKGIKVRSWALAILSNQEEKKAKKTAWQRLNEFFSYEIGEDELKFYADFPLPRKPKIVPKDKKLAEFFSSFEKQKELHELFNNHFQYARRKIKSELTSITI
jgi:hypothetical protein